MRHFCTYFDHRYLSRGLALHESLRQQGFAFKLWVLCLSGPCAEILASLELPGIECILLECLETADPELRAARSSRSLVEYYFTCTPCLPRYLLRTQPGIDLVTYLDSDLYFFADPDPIFAELEGSSVGIIEHRFPPSIRQEFEVYGLYNVGWVSFRNDARGLACLEWWRARCLEWCFDRLEGDRFADQKYLDRWPSLFPGVKVIQHLGANVAPWNIANYRPAQAGDRIEIDGVPVLFYHFEGIKQLGRWLYDPSLKFKACRGKAAARVQAILYRPYLKALGRARARLSRFPEVRRLSTARTSGAAASMPLAGSSQTWRGRLGHWAAVLRSIRDHELMVFVQGVVVFLPSWLGRKSLR